jgi:threonine aldolase
LRGERGIVWAGDVADALKPADVHYPRTRLVCLENTVNKGGGSLYRLSEIRAIREVCERHGLALHLDGARLFNALVETGENPSDYGRHFDTISICLSKGLGAPVGSVLAGSVELIREARRVRKVFGGGWRQAGYLAAAGIYALDHHIDRLRDDHRRARVIAEALRAQPWVRDILPVDTNIVIFRLNGTATAAEFVQILRRHDILAIAFGKQEIRLVTHLNFDDEMLAVLVARLSEIRP